VFALLNVMYNLKVVDGSLPPPEQGTYDIVQSWVDGFVAAAAKAGVRA